MKRAETSSYADYNDMKRAETSSYADYNDMKRAENALDMKLLKIMKMIRAGGRPVEGGNGQGAGGPQQFNPTGGFGGQGGPQQFNPTGGFGGQGGPGGFDSSESSYSSSSSSSSYPYDERQGESSSSYADYNDMKRAENEPIMKLSDLKKILKSVGRF